MFATSFMSGICNLLLPLFRAEDFRALLNCIFCYDWKCDVKVTVAVIHLINEIVSTNSTFLGRAFQLYVKSLLPSMTTSLSTGIILNLFLRICLRKRSNRYFLPCSYLHFTHNCGTINYRIDRGRAGCTASADSPSHPGHINPSPHRALRVISHPQRVFPS